MHGSKLALTVWFCAAYLMASHSNGISAFQLWQQLGLGSDKTARLLSASSAAPWDRGAAPTASARFPDMRGHGIGVAPNAY